MKLLCWLQPANPFTPQSCSKERSASDAPSNSCANAAVFPSLAKSQIKAALADCEYMPIEDVKMSRNKADHLQGMENTVPELEAKPRWQEGPSLPRQMQTLR
jgi:hypothetical protein